MSNKELCINLINSFRDDQLDSIVALLQSTKKLLDDSFDNSFCMQLLDEYENDTEFKTFDGIDDLKTL